LIERAATMNCSGDLLVLVRFPLRITARYMSQMPAHTSRARALALWTVWKFSQEFCTRQDFPSSFPAGLTIGGLSELADIRKDNYSKHVQKRLGEYVAFWINTNQNLIQPERNTPCCGP
jgi:hypothetical protein